MHKYFLIVILLTINTISSLGQYTNKLNHEVDLHRNILKFNLLSPISKLYSIQYERKFNTRWAINGTLFYRDKQRVTLSGTVDNIAKKYGLGITGIKFEYIYMNEAQLGLKGFSPELKYYYGPKKNMFIALFGQYEAFNMTVPALFLIQHSGTQLDVKMPVNFTFNTISGGLMFGKRFNWKRVVLDVVIFGPHLGYANHFLATSQNDLLSMLTANEKVFLRDKIIDRFGLSGKYFAMNIGNTDATIKSIRPIPYVGIRGFGLNLGYKF